MSLLTPAQFLIHNLEGKVGSKSPRIYLPPDKALEVLRRISGEDFEFDGKQWRAWIRQNQETFDKRWQRALQDVRR